MKTTIFCCDAFATSINDAGNRGFSIIAVPYLDAYTFFLQARNKDYAEKDKPGFFVAQTSIRHCPWCGQKLSEIVAENKLEVLELAEKDNYLLLR